LGRIPLASPIWKGKRGLKEGVPKKWVVKDGALCRKGGGDLITRDKYESFELKIDWKISKGGNSGIMFKVLETDGPPYKTGPEAQILHAGKSKETQLAGWLYDLYSTEKTRKNPQANGIISSSNARRPPPEPTSANTG